MQSEKISVKDALKVLVLDPLKASLVSLLFCFLKLLDLLRFSPMFLLLFFFIQQDFMKCGNITKS